MNHRVRSLLAISLGLLLILAGCLIWRFYSVRREWASLRPGVPSSAEAVPGLAARLADLAERLKKWPPDRVALAAFSRTCHANGEFDAAAAGYRALIKLEPDNPHWPYLLATILAGSGRLAESIPLLQRTTSLAPGYLVAWLKIGDASLKLNATAAAENAYNEVLRREPLNPYALFGLARCDLQADRLTAARSHLQQAVAADPNFSGAQSLLGTVFERLGNDEAAAIARANVARGGHYTEPSDPWVEELTAECLDPYTLLTTASAAMADGKPRKALPLLERALQLAPSDARLHRQLGKTLLVLHDASRARHEMERAAALAPTNDAIQLDLLTLLRGIPDEPAAERVILEGVAACPESAALHFEAGLLSARAGKLDEAATHLEFAWVSRPDKTGAALQLAEVNFRRGRAAAGVALLEDVLARFPEDSTAWLMLVRHGIETKDARTAGWLKRAVEARAPATALAELRQAYERRFGATLP